MGYGGDLSEKAMNTKLLNACGSFGASVELDDQFSINALWTYGMIQGDDKYSDTRAFRNLRFKSIIREYSLMGQYNFLSRENHRLSPFACAGIAVFKFNPYLEQGPNIFYLHDYNTEGQGVYNNVKPYHLTQFSVPFGIGFEWISDENTRIGIVGIVRKTFTDYLDDVSGVYAPQELLKDNFGSTSVSLAYRGNLFPGGVRTYPVAGTPRGNPQNKDTYYFLGFSIKLNFRHTFKGILGSGKEKGFDGVRTDCPRW